MSKARDIQPAAQAGPLDLAATLYSLRPEIKKVLTGPKVIERFLRVALTELRLKPDLQRCTAQSIMASIMSAAQLNLEIGGALRHGYLVPYKGECSFQPSYIGLLALARRSKVFADIDAVLVNDGDKFRYVRNPKPELFHEPALWNPGPELGAYVFAVLKNGEYKFLAMAKAEIERVRQSSNAPNSLMWTKYWGEGAKKTVLKRFLKTCELSPELATAIELDDKEYRDTTATVTVGHVPEGKGAKGLAARLRGQLPPPAPEEEGQAPASASAEEDQGDDWPESDDGVASNPNDG